jgi:uncharacterized membrane protein YdcZ (DUF606 family)
MWRWIAVFGLVVLATLALAGIPPIGAYEYAAPDQSSPWPWVIGELVVFAAILGAPVETRLGTRAALVCALCIAAAVPSFLGALGHAKTAYPRVIDVYTSWVIAAFLWSLAVAIAGGVAWLRARTDRA